MVTSYSRDYRRIIRDGVSDEVAARWPSFHLASSELLKFSGSTPQLQIRLPDSGFSFIRIIFGEDIFIDADGDYGPQMQFDYSDPDCVENVLAFILAIAAVPRKSNERQYVEPSKSGRRYLAGDKIDLTEWREQLKEIKRWN